MPSLRGIHLSGEKGDTDPKTHQERRNKCQRVGTLQAQKTGQTLIHLCIENRYLCPWQSCGMTRYYPQSIGRKGLQTRFFPWELKQGGEEGRGTHLLLNSHFSVKENLSSSLEMRTVVSHFPSLQIRALTPGKLHLCRV